MHRKFNDDIFARCLVIMNIEGRLWCHPVTSSMTSSSWKYHFGTIWDDIFLSEAAYNNIMIHMHRKFNDDIFVRCSVITKMLLFHI